MKKIYMLVICLMGVLLLGCSGHLFPNRNRKADDKISCAVYEELGEEVLYQGRKIEEDKSVRYEYYVKGQSGQLGRIHAAVQEVIEQEDIDDKVHIECRYEFLPDCYACVAHFYNYSDGSEYADLEGLQRLNIGGCREEKDGIYNQADTYSDIQGIKYLRVGGEMGNITEEENIDWYEYFPDVETLEVVPIEK